MSGAWTSAWAASPAPEHSSEDPETNRNMAAAQALPPDPGGTIHRENEDSSFHVHFYSVHFLLNGMVFKGAESSDPIPHPHIPCHEAKKLLPFAMRHVSVTYRPTEGRSEDTGVVWGRLDFRSACGERGIGWDDFSGTFPISSHILITQKNAFLLFL